MGKIMSFKEWLMAWYTIDYDQADVTDLTKKIWHDAYENYLKDWETQK